MKVKLYPCSRGGRLKRNATRRFPSRQYARKAACKDAKLEQIAKQRDGDWQTLLLCTVPLEYAWP